MALARALVIEPDVLLLDEPLSNLDYAFAGRDAHRNRTIQHWRLSITTIFVTHDQTEALAMSDRIAVMNQGRVVEIDTPQQLCDAPSHPLLRRRSLEPARSFRGNEINEIFSAPGLLCADAPSGFKRDRAARLAPSHIRRKSDGRLSLNGILKTCTYLGDTFEIDVETASGSVRVVMPSRGPAAANRRRLRDRGSARRYQLFNLTTLERERRLPMTMDRRTFGKLVLGAGALAPYGFSRTAIAQPKPGDELVIGIWGGAQERIVKQHVEKALVEKFGCKVSYVLGGTPERRARAYAGTWPAELRRDLSEHL